MGQSGGKLAENGEGAGGVSSSSEGASSGGCPSSLKGAPAEGGGGGGGGGCPVEHEQQQQPLRYNPATNDVMFGNERGEGQKGPLGLGRETSNIPMGAKKSPHEKPVSSHQPMGSDNWVYPSEQQYFNAMKKKGWDVKERDVPVVLAIHNAVNEQGWKEIRKWESLLPGRPEPRLKRFMGKPKERSPRAWWKTTVEGALPPFDRHDWIVERGSEEIRYVIDFYSGTPTPRKPVAFHLDVRPALDSPRAFMERFLMWAKEDLGFDIVDMVGYGVHDGAGGEKEKSNVS